MPTCPITIETETESCKALVAAGWETPPLRPLPPCDCPHPPTHPQYASGVASYERKRLCMANARLLLPVCYQYSTGSKPPHPSSPLVRPSAPQRGEAEPRLTILEPLHLAEEFLRMAARLHGRLGTNVLCAARGVRAVSRLLAARARTRARWS
eukprot:360894-Chlamydomonas_euryale.AAC.7